MLREMFFGTDADRHADVSRNGSSGFGGNADGAEVADSSRSSHDVGDGSALHVLKNIPFHDR
jgi:hypothetical protein